MVERRPWLTFFSHLVLMLGVASVALPVWLALTAATHDSSAFVSGMTPLWFGDKGLSVFQEVLTEGTSRELKISVAGMLWNSFLMAMGISLGKLVISILSAYAVVYFRFPGRMLAFWVIFMTLMLPVEVRIMPTFQVIADLNMLNSMPGLTIPLIASATATFLFRQFFMTVPGEMLEAARIDGAGPFKFFKDILLPLSRTNIAALFVITFIYGWNQYLWPILITTDDQYYTIVMSIQRMLSVGDGEVEWNRVMATTLMAMLPPVLVVLGMQKLFVKGLVETEK
ncbi:MULTISPECIES: sn-glycerol-3-phosphate ABC transporter permease UgpE [Salinivibrio]|jgi:sn-glycerol 3-phosphate transport system permease protein|uniref:sn-glycerol-3-phosphate transport system permease protein UgpE n=3 Tax=Salinivibrio TaxID=51366 RepID=A0ABY7LFD8_9GAMM|nr:MULTISPECIES: sn-glycerol-3-phosphate ABC transporter permease UgpE [Salinivibrio]ODQ00692.1 glycerol-3-phosphate transporter [Salinivibrio sp. DV]OOF22073.1 glycerol-3-phosphate transporter [Salinivibrio sp. IB574]PCE67129.1 glycerol-3-phosphate transporter [Salinivibrio sp. YCSC6]QCF35974.1 sn-glycerol-3-phosphate ABC transporter permease UgpE [Salinivibrio sp. YCSC6]QIR06044.1 sn-glycerol-3-phosphate ABC transporter permease UgpE [Salinivibrio costicola]